MDIQSIDIRIKHLRNKTQQLSADILSQLLLLQQENKVSNDPHWLHKVRGELMEAHSHLTSARDIIVAER